MSFIEKENNIGKQKSNPKDIKIVCTDVDGTLITPDVQVTPRISEAIKKLKEKGYIVVICTGKSKGPWVRNVEKSMGSMAGVYINGTSIEDEEGNFVYEKSLSEEALKICFDFSSKHGMTIVPYHRHETFAVEHNEFTKVISEHLLEPLPKVIPSLYDLIGKVPI